MSIAGKTPLKAPFPYPGGKSAVADMVWARLGNVANYLEPFAGSLATLLRRPADHFANGYRVETVNDANSYLVNFWRCLEKGLHAEVAKHADWPVMEADLHARHRWLVRSDEAHGWRTQFVHDPDFCDPKIAGWWCWGQCCWIGSGWCGESVVDHAARPIITGSEGQLGRGVHSGAPESLQIPELASNMGRGVTAAHIKRSALGNARGVTNLSHSKALEPTDWEQRPVLGDAGRGVAGDLVGGRPQLADAFDIGRGVNSNGNAALSAQVPHISNRGQGVNALPPVDTCSARRDWLIDWMQRLSDRLRLVRTCYGHWNRICDSDSTLTRLGTTGVFLDPPYPLVQKVSGKKSRAGNLYATDAGQDLCKLRDEVLDWCRRWGHDKAIRVALCCYEGDGYEP